MARGNNQNQLGKHSLLGAHVYDEAARKWVLPEQQANKSKVRYRVTTGSLQNNSATMQNASMQYGGSGTVKIPNMECQLAAKYVTSKPVDLPTVPAKTEIDEETNRILENMDLEKQIVEEDQCSNFEDQIYSISLVEVWMKGYENDVKRLLDMGFSDEVIALAFTALPVLSTMPNADLTKNLASFCTNFNQMKGMGFSQASIVGSLIKHRNNLEASISECVD